MHVPSRPFYRYPYREDDDGTLCNFTLWACDNKDRLNGRVRRADGPSREAPDCAPAFVSLAADDGGASPSESEDRLPLVAPVGDIGRAGRCASVGLPPTAPMDTAALREEPMLSGGTDTGRSIADSAGKRVAGHPEGEVVDRGREAEESRCTAVSGNGGSSAFIVASREMYMLISEEPSGGVVGEHSVTSRNGTIVGGFGSREVWERMPRGGGDSPVESTPSCDGKSIFKCGTGRALF